MTNAIARFKGQRVSKEQMESKAHFIDKLLLSSSLLNDLYSFPKEFDDHSTKNTLDTIGNAIALLMSSYGYTEDEASRILKQEIQTLEAQGLEGFKRWENSNLFESEELVSYVFTVVYTMGGFNYWMSHSDRYFRNDLRTTARDRAKLVADGSGLRRLENHPPPLSKRDASLAKPLDSMPQVPTEASNATFGNGPLGPNEHRDIGTSIDSQFRKADSEKVCETREIAKMNHVTTNHSAALHGTI